MGGGWGVRRCHCYACICSLAESVCHREWFSPLSVEHQHCHIYLPSHLMGSVKTTTLNNNFPSTAKGVGTNTQLHGYICILALFSYNYDVP